MRARLDQARVVASKCLIFLVPLILSNLVALGTDSASDTSQYLFQVAPFDIPFKGTVDGDSNITLDYNGQTL